MIAGSRYSLRRISPDRDWVQTLHDRVDLFTKNPGGKTAKITHQAYGQSPQEQLLAERLASTSDRFLNTPVRYVPTIDDRSVGRFDPGRILIAGKAQGRDLDQSLLQLKVLGHEMGHAYYTQFPNKFQGLRYDPVFGEFNPHANELVAESIGYGIINKALPNRRHVLMPSSAKFIGGIHRLFEPGQELMDWDEMGRHRVMLNNKQQLDDAVNEIVHWPRVAPVLNDLISYDWRVSR